MQILGDLVLLAQPGVDQGLSDAVGAAVELGPGGAAVSLLLSEGGRNLVGDCLEYIGEVPTLDHVGREYPAIG